MDRKSQQNPEILSLIARSATARSVIHSEVGKLTKRLDVVGRLRDSLRGKPSSWLLGSSAVGLAAGILFPRFRRTAPNPRANPKSMTMRLLGMVWTAAQPLAKVWLANQLRSWITQRALSPVPHSHNQPR